MKAKRFWILAIVPAMLATSGTADAATLITQWSGVGGDTIQLAPGQVAEIEIWVDLDGGESLCELFYSNLSTPEVFQVDTMPMLPDWMDASVPGGYLGDGAQAVHFTTSIPAGAYGPGTFLIGIQTVLLDHGSPPSILTVMPDEPTMMLVDCDSFPLTFPPPNPLFIEVVALGACCDWSTFNCQNNVIEADCTGPDDEWTEGTLCANLDPPCALTPMGTAFTYQGRLMDEGLPANEDYDLQFTLYNASASGAVVAGPISLEDEPVDYGLFTVQLDFGSDIFTGDARWLEIGVRPWDSVDPHTVLAPRQEITPAPHAMFAEDAETAAVADDADKVDGYHVSDLDGRYVNEGQGNSISSTMLQNSAVTSSKIDSVAVTTDKITNNAVTDAKISSVSWGKITGAPSSFPPNGPAAGDLSSTYPNPTVARLQGRSVSAAAPGSGQTLKWNGSSWAPTDDGLTLPYSGSASTSGRMLSITNTSSVTDATAVYGRASATSGSTIGGHFHSDSPSGKGVFGVSWGTSGKGVVGSHGTTTGAGKGVEGMSFSSDGYGVYGVNWSTSSHAPGVYGKHDVSDDWGFGVVGIGGDTGVSGSVLPTGSGSYYGTEGTVSGGSGTNYGIYGAAYSGDVNYGIYGTASGGSDWWAGYFHGDVNVTGTLSKGGGGFKIDHPLDPENKNLHHSFVESPDMKNVYDGVAVLNAGGEAWVELPEWFETLNSDFRYQLTAIGAPMPDLYIAEEISENTFRIAGGEPGLKVSWQVTGIRQDPFANANRIPVEEDKRAEDHGKYLHPVAYGLSEEMGIDYASERAHWKAEPAAEVSAGQMAEGE